MRVSKAVRAVLHSVLPGMGKISSVFSNSRSYKKATTAVHDMLRAALRLHIHTHTGSLSSVLALAGSECGKLERLLKQVLNAKLHGTERVLSSSLVLPKGVERLFQVRSCHVASKADPRLLRIFRLQLLPATSSNFLPNTQALPAQASLKRQPCELLPSLRVSLPPETPKICTGMNKAGKIEKRGLRADGSVDKLYPLSGQRQQNQKQ